MNTTTVTIEITVEQAKVIVEALEIAAEVAHKNDDFDAYAWFQMTYLIYTQVPQLTGLAYSEQYQRLSNSL